MSDISTVNIELHHHGKFLDYPECYYIGGNIEVLNDIDTDLLSFRDLENWAKLYKYNSNCLMYLKNDGHSFQN